jgi:hypothetical protein
MNDMIYYGSATTELWEVMWEETPLHRKSSKMDYGGMKRYMLDHVIFVKEWVSLHDEMNYHFNQFDLYKHLRSGRLTSLDRSTPQLSIQSLGTLLPPLTTLHIGLRKKLFRITRPILMLGSFLRILSLDLDVLGV